MFAMINVNEDEHRVLLALGERLKALRLAQNLRQGDFARRLGVTRQTYSKLEAGDPAISVGYWIRALNILGRLDEFEHVIAPSASLFERFDLHQRAAQRKRARPK